MDRTQKWMRSVGCLGQIENIKRQSLITTSEHVKETSGYVLSVITYENGYFVHENHHSYYEEIGAEKYLTIALGRKWTGGDVMDDYC